MPQIGFFPTPYEDESVYSLYARYGLRVQYPGTLALIRELTGSVNPIHLTYLPSRLQHLVDSLPSGHCLSSDTLIAHHTVFPMHARFWSAERARQIHNAMRLATSIKVEAAAGIHASQIRLPHWLRFCPVCAREDQKRVGERYWHRLHQIPGVAVCPEHAVFLEDSKVPTRHYGQWERLITADEAMNDVSPRPCQSGHASHRWLLTFAREFQWLLQPAGPRVDLHDLRQRYMNQLMAQGLATWNGRLRGTAILEAVKQFYPRDLLSRLQCEIEERRRSNWVLKLVYATRMESAHPLHHLLVIHWLGYNVEEFLTLPVMTQPFGGGPWPCLNSASRHYRELVIKECAITSAASGGRPVGTFGCPQCGFTYARRGPDRSPDDPFRIGKVKRWGAVWESSLKDLWGNPVVELKEMQRRLGVCFATIKRQSQRLGLSSIRPGGRVKPGSSQSIVQTSQQKRCMLFQSNVERYQTIWLLAQEQNPGVGRAELARRHTKVKTYLYRHAREWLREHQPPRKKRMASTREVDWGFRDQEIKKEVKNSAERFRAQPGKPVRITVHAIRKELRGSGRHYLTGEYRERFPKTFALLAQVAESVEAFALRRVQWAKDRFVQENVIPSRRQLVRRVGLSLATRARPRVKSAIDAALARLRSLDGAN